MRYPRLDAVRTTLLAAALALAPTLHAQPAKDTSAQQAGPQAGVWPEIRRQQDMQKLMQDMAQEMVRMQEQMGKEGMTPEMRRAMAARMKRMSELMRRMSGLMDRPAMREPEMKKQFDDMRKQMDQMMKDPSMNEPSK